MTVPRSYDKLVAEDLVNAAYKAPVFVGFVKRK
jgi:hypothetical protein